MGARMSKNCLRTSRRSSSRKKCTVSCARRPTAYNDSSIRSQLWDAADSVESNIAEGFYSVSILPSSPTSAVTRVSSLAEATENGFDERHLARLLPALPIARWR